MTFRPTHNFVLSRFCWSRKCGGGVASWLNINLLPIDIYIVIVFEGPTCCFVKFHDDEIVYDSAGIHNIEGDLFPCRNSERVGCELEISKRDIDFGCWPSSSTSRHIQ